MRKMPCSTWDVFEHQRILWSTWPALVILPVSFDTGCIVSYLSNFQTNKVTKVNLVGCISPT